jgi:simple sugar transport system substrate-binding protein
MSIKIPVLASIAVTLTFALTACGSDSTPKAEGADAKVEVALINGVLTGNESVCAFSGAKHVLDEAGDEWSEKTSAYDVEGELDNVNAAIQQGADLIFIWSAFPQSASAAVRAAKAADIPIFLFFNSANNVQDDILGGGYYDFRGGGAAAGSWIADTVPGAKVIELTGSLGSGTAEASSQGLDDGLSGSDAELVDRQDAEWSADKAATLASTLIAKHPDANVIVLPNDAMALSVLRVVKQLGKADAIKVISTSVSNPDGLAAIADGSIAYPGYDPLAQYGADSMTRALDLLSGETDNTTLDFGPSHLGEDVDAADLSFCYDEYSS